ncbi:hypothetical protein HME9302_01342 [Alteripontixanthobacter maritimus]|uniref:MvaI/BcnI restriction endonuclease domain-containing protein n=1 Tax=Alteripontixanthobacter maritimus TaxID=2161824 RepID=A0A369Q5H6_9SPHN|nr:MvaI/BcnI family restriction endonuclease [Alteripontixanthobacter maritimus]RDC60143.1 hypothetical protein HME9302_01342 [Alteripontixanthobacter maritimus]
MFASLEDVLAKMRENGAARIYAKELAPNDNSKNQVYLGGDFSALNVLPHGDIYTDETDLAGSVRDRAKAEIEFYWIDHDGKHLAPNAGLILYPKYPEVRMSGFLLGCNAAPSPIMRVRETGRVLILGVTPSGKILGYAAGKGDVVAEQVLSGDWPTIGIFLELPLWLDSTQSSRAILLSELRRIWEMHWIASQKLGGDGFKKPYSARNGGGYTLEAELGVAPNSYAEPDFRGWEIKQYSVRDFEKFAPKSPVTLMTPEPNGGIYRTEGVQEFIRRFGYPDRSGKPDRMNFGGRYDCRRGAHPLTGLRMSLNGYDQSSGTISDLDGGLELVDAQEQVAASWTFKGLMKHWNRKHAQAAYVPSLFQTPPPQYRYGPLISLCEQTDFLLFLKAFASGRVYYDPAVKIEAASTASPKIKRRSQFRVAHMELPALYKLYERIQF